MSSVENLKSSILQSISAADNLSALEEIRISSLGKKGSVTALVKSVSELPADERKAAGALFNSLKSMVSDAIDAKKAELDAASLLSRLKDEKIDVSAPVRSLDTGRIHPISQTIDEIVSIFANMGFSVAKGPDIESEYYNFEALNLPSSHPARDMQATFFVPDAEPESLYKTVLRTQTSPVQIHAMLDKKPPIRIITPGRTYRCDYDQTHTPMFHQVEGLVIDETSNMSHLKGCLLDFLRAFFAIDDLPIRFRASYFPFTEPSAEVDIGCSKKDGKLKMGNFGDWLEILGCGMVHPNVLSNCGIDPQKYQGFAFGMGIERIAMLKYGIPDLRTFFDSDLRWLRHYGFLPLDIPNSAFGNSLMK
ncbi:MAG: phenylalanine--tRNA ligase subunit alpha [Alphaproteobacteria bacterium]|nr:phenylalanine--tRNA ligase subunit alpha [Alphaproteobacteria bacterium]MCL2506008.1 phenylalanine--tRNA ligase subunit alpha [Alphaproteobacteria bacterium]